MYVEITQIEMCFCLSGGGVGVPGLQKFENTKFLHFYIVCTHEYKCIRKQIV